MATFAAILTSVAVYTPPAYADIIAYTLGVPNSDVTTTGPFATVAVDLTSSTTATVTFDSLINGGYIYLMGGESAADVNVNANSWTVGNLGGIALSSFGGPSLTDNGGKQVDSFGNFNQTLKEFDGFQHALSEISFTLTDTSGTWSSAANVLTPNASGYMAAIHVFSCSEAGGGCTNQTGAFQTGYVANGARPGTGTLPEPASLILLGVGLLGIGLMRRQMPA